LEESNEETLYEIDVEYTLWEVILYQWLFEKMYQIDCWDFNKLIIVFIIISNVANRIIKLVIIDRENK
jgi:hypothetical protein